MRSLARIAEERIREAIERGEFDNLAGKGKPLYLEEDLSVPEDLRVGYRILKNAGVLPPEMELRREILSLEDLISACGDDPVRERRLRGQLVDRLLKYRILMERRQQRK